MPQAGLQPPKGGGSDRSGHAIEPIGTETITQTRRQVQAAGPARVLGPEDRSDIKTEMPNRVEIKPIEPRLDLI